MHASMDGGYVRLAWLGLVGSNIKIQALHAKRMKKNVYQLGNTIIAVVELGQYLDGRLLFRFCLIFAVNAKIRLNLISCPLLVVCSY